MADKDERPIAANQQNPIHAAGSGWRPTRMEWLLGGALVLLGLALWFGLRRSGDAPWNDKAIAADFQTLTIQKPDGPPEAGQTPGDVHLIFRYRLRNLTNKAWQVPEPKVGVLMKSVSGGGWQEVDSVLWDNHLTIPARKAAEVEFDMAIPSTDPGAPEPPKDNSELAAAGTQRLRQIGDLALFDYQRRYVIHLPKGWG